MKYAQQKFAHQWKVCGESHGMVFVSNFSMSYIMYNFEFPLCSYVLNSFVNIFSILYDRISANICNKSHNLFQK